jgi:hypothetical protein
MPLPISDKIGAAFLVYGEASYTVDLIAIADPAVIFAP